MSQPEIEVFGKKSTPDLELGPLPVPLPLIPEGDYLAISRTADIIFVFTRRIEVRAMEDGVPEILDKVDIARIFRVAIRTVSDTRWRAAVGL